MNISSPLFCHLFIGMTFLNPFVLFGLAAAAIPILIHLLNKRKLRTIDFSTLAFLKELQRSTMRRITVRQWVLLALRTLLIVMLVLAFARPALHGSIGTAGAHAATSVVIILDNTASMALSNERGTHLDQAKERARQIAELLEPQDDAAVIRLGDLPLPAPPVPVHDPAFTLRAIDGTLISPRYRTVDDALRTAAAVLASSKNANKEVYVLTDGQRSTLRRPDEWRDAPPEPLFGPDVRFFIAPSCVTPAENWGIRSVTMPDGLLLPGKPVTVRASVVNYGTRRTENHIVTLSSGGTTLMQKSLSLDGGESGTAEFTLTPERAGFISGEVTLESDPFEADDVRSFAFHVPERLRIVLVTPDETAARYITAALTVPNTLSAAGATEVRRLSVPQLTAAGIEDAGLVILAGVPALSEGQRTLLRSHVVAGGAMIFFPGQDSTAGTYRYLESFGLPPGTAVQAPADAPMRFGAADLEFPLFRGMFDGAQRKERALESPDIRTAYSLPARKEMRTVIALSNGVPFLWIRELSRGRILGFAVPARPGWSDLTSAGLFVPLLYQSALYLSSLASLEAMSASYTAGEPAEFPASLLVGRGALSPELTLTDPERRPAPLRSYARTNGDGSITRILTAPELPSPGLYRIVAGRDTVGMAAATMDERESESALASVSESASGAERLGALPANVTVLAPDEPLAESVRKSRYGTELWRGFALAALLLGLAEMLIARERKNA
ncbi:MAG: VWA domain-containing protein [Bacteroidetes bacterium]|nr:MAG: VWA domain-containing protein [Bacteroidota bacterium]